MIKALEIKTFINLDFANNTILFCFFFFFLIIELYFLIPAVITQIFNPTTKLVTPRGIATKEAKTDMKTQSGTVETKINKSSI